MKNISFLIVDDSPTLRTLVCRTIKATFGSEDIHEAGNGQEALKLLRDIRIDLIISDWNMPVMDGEEFLYEVRQDPNLKNIPFIMMTTNADRDFLITAIQLGVTQYIVKPFSPDELERKARISMNSLNKRRAARYALPEHVATIRIDGATMSGEIFDLSRTGARMRLDNHTALGLYKTCEVNLRILDLNGLEAGEAVIDSLSGMIVRLTAEDTLHPTSRQCQMGLYFNPGMMPRPLELKLNRLIKWLAESRPDVIGGD
jgi:CheY-like chemotaxis protein